MHPSSQVSERIDRLMASCEKEDSTGIHVGSTNLATRVQAPDDEPTKQEEQEDSSSLQGGRINRQSACLASIPLEALYNPKIE